MRDKTSRIPSSINAAFGMYGSVLKTYQKCASVLNPSRFYGNILTTIKILQFIADDHLV